MKKIKLTIINANNIENEYFLDNCNISNYYPSLNKINDNTVRITIITNNMPNELNFQIQNLIRNYLK